MTTGVGLTQWKKFAVERLPIPKSPPASGCRIKSGMTKTQEHGYSAHTPEEKQHD